MTDEWAIEAERQHQERMDAVQQQAQMTALTNRTRSLIGEFLTRMSKSGNPGVRPVVRRRFRTGLLSREAKPVDSPLSQGWVVYKEHDGDRAYIECALTREGDVFSAYDDGDRIVVQDSELPMDDWILVDRITLERLVRVLGQHGVLTI